MPTRSHARMGLLGAGAVALVAGGVFSFVLSGVVGLGLFVAYAGIGGFLAARLHGNQLGWMLILIGAGVGLGSAQVEGDPALLASGSMDAGEVLAAWANGTGWAIGFTGIIGLVLLFPDGRLEPGRWRWFGRLAIGITVMLAGLIILGPTVNVGSAGGRGTTADVPNPLAVLPNAAFWRLVPPTDLLYSAMFAIFALGALGLLVRFLGASGSRRLQYQWLVAAIVVVAVATGAWAVLEIVLHSPLAGPALAVGLVAYSAIPIAIAVAVLRYRLYDIHIIIRRSVTYVTLTVLLGTVYAAVVLGLQAALQPVTQGDGIAVAGATLLVVVIFGPVRRRIQRTVDRRFDRAGYDIQRVVEDLALRQRMEVDLATLVDDLRRATDTSLHPATVSVWLRASPLGRPRQRVEQRDDLIGLHGRETVTAGAHVFEGDTSGE